MLPIEIVADDDSISTQARTYAEYRVFAALARHARRVRRARVALHRHEAGGTRDGVTCAVTVVLEPSGSLRVRATGAHVYAAINRAVDRIGAATGQTREPASSWPSRPGR